MLWKLASVNPVAFYTDKQIILQCELWLYCSFVTYYDVVLFRPGLYTFTSGVQAKGRSVVVQKNFSVFPSGHTWRKKALVIVIPYNVVGGSFRLNNFVDWQSSTNYFLHHKPVAIKLYSGIFLAAKHILNCAC